MFDAVELLLVSLAVVLGGAAFAVGAQVIRATWRDAAPVPPLATRPAPRARPPGRSVPLRGIAAFEALKALAALAAAFALLALGSRPGLLDPASAVLGHLGLSARAAQAFSAFDQWLAADRGPLLLGAAAYAGLHLTEAWGLWQARPWGEALGAATGAIYLPFEIGHLLHRPGPAAAAVLALNLAVVAFLVWRLRLRAASAR